jgi:hypothetical protein
MEALTQANARAAGRALGEVGVVSSWQTTALKLYRGVSRWGEGSGAHSLKDRVSCASSEVVFHRYLADQVALSQAQFSIIVTTPYCNCGLPAGMRHVHPSWCRR